MRLGFRLTLTAALLLAALPVLGQDPPATPAAPAAPESTRVPPRIQDKIEELQFIPRDSLVVEITRYSRMISAMRDSLSLAELGLGVELAPEDKAKLERSIQNFTILIEEIGSELGNMDLEIADNRISLLDAEGEGIVINIPENFGENLDKSLSQGLNAISRLIIAELPDSLHGLPRDGKGWRDIAFQPFAKPEKRKVVKGNIVKVWDRLQVAANEDVRGHVVVVFGDAEVAGRVDGNVVVVFGDLQLTATTEVTGQVVAVGGRLVQDPEARVHDVVQVDPWSRLGTRGPEGILDPGPINFLLGQGEFLATLVFAVLAFTLAPVRRLEVVRATLVGRPWPSLAAGLVGSFLGHTLVVVVMAILILTVIGIPVALLLGLALLIVGVISVGLAALVIGQKICQGFSGSCGANWLAVIVGLLVLHLISFLGQLLGLWPVFSGLSGLLVILGAAVKLAAYFFGLGALLLGRFGSPRAIPAESPVD